MIKLMLFFYYFSVVNKFMLWNLTLNNRAKIQL